MSFIDLDESPRKAELMEIAWTIRAGKSEGEMAREINPKWQRMKKEAQKKAEAANRG